MNTVGWSATETIGYNFPNLNFGGHDRTTAYKLVREGKGKWAQLQGGVLGFVCNDYKLKMWEHFLRETASGFEVIE